jgi:hypothetical protein
MPVVLKQSDVPFPLLIGTFVGRDGQAYEVKQKCYGRDDATIAKSREAAMQMIAAYVAGQTQGMMLGVDFELVPIAPKERK